MSPGVTDGEMHIDGTNSTRPVIGPRGERGKGKRLQGRFISKALDLECCPYSDPFLYGTSVYIIEALLLDWAIWYWNHSGIDYFHIQVRWNTCISEGYELWCDTMPLNVGNMWLQKNVGEQWKLAILWKLKRKPSDNSNFGSSLHPAFGRDYSGMIWQLLLCSESSISTPDSAVRPQHLNITTTPVDCVLLPVCVWFSILQFTESINPSAEGGEGF